MNNIVNLGIVGCGGFMYNTLAPMLRNLPVRLVAVCDLDKEKAARFASFYRAEWIYTDYMEMLDKERLDAVICVANAATHYAVAKACLLRGVDVFVEKNPAETTEQVRELAALSAKTGRIVAVGYNRRETTAYVMAKEIITNSGFAPAMYYSKFNASIYSSNEYFVFNHITHHLDLARFLLGELSDITANARLISDKSGVFVVNFRAGNVLGTIQCASMLEEAYPMERLDVVGAGGDVTVDNVRDLRFNRTAPARDTRYDIPLQRDGDTLSWNLSNGYGIGNGIYSYLGMEAEMFKFINAVRKESPDAVCVIGDCVGTFEALGAVRGALGI